MAFTAVSACWVCAIVPDVDNRTQLTPRLLIPMNYYNNSLTNKNKLDNYINNSLTM